MKKRFNINEQYKLYLEKIELPEEKMSDIQRTQLKQAFYAGFGQCLLIINQDIPKLEEQEAMEALDHLMAQAVSFWMSYNDKLFN